MKVLILHHLYKIPEPDNGYGIAPGGTCKYGIGYSIPNRCYEITFGSLSSSSILYNEYLSIVFSIAVRQKT
jgi:hypothetical protein